jgi:hypothetical protein
MDASLLEDLISKNQPFRVDTASGRVFEVPHRDFVSFTPKRTSILITFEEDGAEHFCHRAAADHHCGGDAGRAGVDFADCVILRGV